MSISVANPARDRLTAVSVFNRMITNVYIDGFNFYYGAVKDTAWKWLDFAALFGSFLSHIVKMPLADGSGYVDVIWTQEKGSDVNLGAQMLLDGFKHEYECAVVVSNDSDLLRPIQIAIQDLGKKVGVLAPTRNEHPSRSLSANATFIKHIRPNVLKASQFPATLKDERGKFSKPLRW